MHKLVNQFGDILEYDPEFGEYRYKYNYNGRFVFLGCFSLYSKAVNRCKKNRISEDTDPVFVDETLPVYETYEKFCATHLKGNLLLKRFENHAILGFLLYYTDLKPEFVFRSRKSLDTVIGKMKELAKRYKLMKNYSIFEAKTETPIKLNFEQIF